MITISIIIRLSFLQMVLFILMINCGMKQSLSIVNKRIFVFISTTVKYMKEVFKLLIVYMTSIIKFVL